MGRLPALQDNYPAFPTHYRPSCPFTARVPAAEPAHRRYHLWSHHTHPLPPRRPFHPPASCQIWWPVDSRTNWSRRICPPPYRPPGTLRCPTHATPGIPYLTAIPCLYATLHALHLPAPAGVHGIVLPAGKFNWTFYTPPPYATWFGGLPTHALPALPHSRYLTLPHLPNTCRTVNTTHHLPLRRRAPPTRRLPTAHLPPPPAPTPPHTIRCCAGSYRGVPTPTTPHRNHPPCGGSPPTPTTHPHPTCLSPLPATPTHPPLPDPPTLHYSSLIDIPNDWAQFVVICSCRFNVCLYRYPDETGNLFLLAIRYSRLVHGLGIDLFMLAPVR